MYAYIGYYIYIHASQQSKSPPVVVVAQAQNCSWHSFNIIESIAIDVLCVGALSALSGWLFGRAWKRVTMGSYSLRLGSYVVTYIATEDSPMRSISVS